MCHLTQVLVRNVLSDLIPDKTQIYRPTGPCPQSYISVSASKNPLPHYRFLIIFAVYTNSLKTIWKGVLSQIDHAQSAVHTNGHQYSAGRVVALHFQSILLDLEMHVCCHVWKKRIVWTEPRNKWSRALSSSSSSSSSLSSLKVASL